LATSRYVYHGGLGGLEEEDDIQKDIKDDQENIDPLFRTSVLATPSTTVLTSNT
jgi:hypothetical protein